MTSVEKVSQIAAIAHGLLLTGTGIHGLFNPINSAKAFGFPTANTLSTLYWTTTAARNITIGILLLTFSYLKEYKSLGITSIALTVTGLEDFRMVYKFGGIKEAFKHALTTGVLTGLGIKLLGY